MIDHVHFYDTACTQHRQHDMRCQLATEEGSGWFEAASNLWAGVAWGLSPALQSYGPD